MCDTACHHAERAQPFLLDDLLLRGSKLRHRCLHLGGAQTDLFFEDFVLPVQVPGAGTGFRAGS